MTERFGESGDDKDIEQIMMMPGESQVALIKALLTIVDDCESASGEFPMDLFSEPGVLTPTPTIVYTAQPEGKEGKLQYAYEDGRPVDDNGFVSVIIDPSGMTPTPVLTYGSQAYKRYPLDREVFERDINDINTAVLLCLGKTETPVRQLPPVEPVRDYTPIEIDFGEMFVNTLKIDNRNSPGPIPPLEISLEDFGTPMP